MTGAGTQDNPYIIETWTDLFDGVGYYCRLAKDLDGNDYNDGIMPIRTQFPSDLDGAGHTIRNIYNITGNPSASYNIVETVGGTWENVTIENCITDSTFLNNVGNKMQNFLNCKFSVSAFVMFGGGLTLKECTVSCDLMQGLALGNYSTSFERCTAKIKISNPREAPLRFNCNTCRIEAEFLNPITGYSSSRPLETKNSVVAIRFHEDETTNFSIIGNIFLPSVVDSDLWGNTPKGNIGDGIIFLSTLDMKNADALNAAGFQVVRVS